MKQLILLSLVTLTIYSCQENVNQQVEIADPFINMQELFGKWTSVGMLIDGKFQLPDNRTGINSLLLNNDSTGLIQTNIKQSIRWKVDAGNVLLIAPMDTFGGLFDPHMDYLQNYHIKALDNEGLVLHDLQFKTYFIEYRFIRVAQ